MNEICDNIDGKLPKICILNPTENSGRAWKIVAFVFVSLLLVLFIFMFAYRRTIKKEMAKELNSKVSEAANVYFSLKKEKDEI